MSAHEPPLGVAIIVCERVITEEGTGNKSLISIFNEIHAPTFPCQHERLCVYLALTNGTGKQHIELRLKCLSDKIGEEPLMKLVGDIVFPDPNAVVELIFDLRRVVFLRAGSYAFEVHADNQFVFEGRFTVKLQNLT